MPVQISASVDENTKQRFDRVCEDFGVTPSNAISMFITNAVLLDSIPFSEEVPVKKAKRTREEMFDCARGKFNIPDDFNEPLEDFREYMG
jgi:addiction module RelB/DinJ family antitoxin